MGCSGKKCDISVAQSKSTRPQAEAGKLGGFPEKAMLRLKLGTSSRQEKAQVLETMED